MSRAFVKEDDTEPPVRITLPDRDDPAFDAAAALALLDAARNGYIQQAEVATGYRWGDPQLHPFVRKLMNKEKELPEDEQDRRYIQVARRFLGER